ncbi:MAG: sirohydrochlorin chelatase, partial [Synechocystis sp.]|nr:sirohydrochlorin chelatase [Synechocystis sp.]
LVSQTLAAVNVPTVTKAGFVNNSVFDSMVGSPGDRLAVLTKPPLTVLSASLECQPLPLHQQIAQAIRPLITQGITEMKILPLFLSPGVHVCDDLPTEVNQAQMKLGSRCQLTLLPHLGSLPALPAFLAHCFEQYQTQPQAQRLLLAHGSRRTGGNTAIANVAQSLNAQVAFWKTEPSLGQALSRFSLPAQVVILPYFLFAGGITDLIQTQIQQLRTQYPELDLILGDPLGPHPVLARLIAEALTQG